MQRSKSRRLAAEAAEKERVEREGLVVLRLKMADLFGKKNTICVKLDHSVENVKGTLLHH